MNQPASPDIRTLCRHILPQSESAPAHSCGSPALRGERFCFYHHPARERRPNRTEQRSRARERRLARRTVSVLLPRTRPELLASLHHVMSLLAANDIDLHRAGLLIEALKSAGNALRE
jgi:hypothetical protein